MLDVVDLVGNAYKMLSGPTNSGGGGCVNPWQQLLQQTVQGISKLKRLPHFFYLQLI